jgi:hypothetical protein
MILTFHIFMTVVSLFFAGYMGMHPVKTKLRITYIAILCTGVSGLLFVYQNPQALIHMIMSGAFYMATIVIYLATAHHKLEQTAKQRRQNAFS